MPMTRAEKAQMEALRIRAAFSWPPPPPPRLSAEEIGSLVNNSAEKLAVLWTYNAYSTEVTQGCTNGIHHCRTGTDRITTQSAGGPWFHTKADAIRALRSEKAAEFAKQLARLEQQLAEAEGATP